MPKKNTLDVNMSAAVPPSMFALESKKVLPES